LGGSSVSLQSQLDGPLADERPSMTQSNRLSPID
jgi:hypothetical protein